MLFTKKNYLIPADVPSTMEKEYSKNYGNAENNNLFLFACDQKIEHLNKDFYGQHISSESLNPEHAFKIASYGFVGKFATHLGLISRYGKLYPTVPYIVKLNGKTDLVSIHAKDPLSAQLWTVHDAIRLKEEHALNIQGVGYTLYIGSEYESQMLEQAAQIIYQAHQHGLITILWVYARGKAIKDDQDPHIIAGSCGIAASLGADFVKVKPPHSTPEKTSAQWLELATEAAGNTKVICSGGEQVDPKTLLTTIYEQITVGKSAGCAVGRNIFQRSLRDAVAMSYAISAIVYSHANVQDAIRLYSEFKIEKS